MPTSRLIAALLTAVLLGFAALAAAAPTIRLSDGFTTLTVADGDANDANAAAGIVAFDGAIGGWRANTTTGFGAPQVPQNQLELLSAHVSNLKAGGYIDVMLSDVGFSLGSGPQLAQFLTAIEGLTQGTVAWALWISQDNTLFEQDTLIRSESSVGASFADLFTNPTLVDGTFSMTLAVRVTHGNADGLATSFHYRAQVVPEPDTLVLIGAALLGLALIRRRRR